MVPKQQQDAQKTWIAGTDIIWISINCPCCRHFGCMYMCIWVMSETIAINTGRRRYNNLILMCNVIYCAIQIYLSCSHCQHYTNVEYIPQLCNYPPTKAITNQVRRLMCDHSVELNHTDDTCRTPKQLWTWLVFVVLCYDLSSRDFTHML